MKKIKIVWEEIEYVWEKIIHFYYDLKWGFWALRKYFGIIINMRDYDYSDILIMLRLQIDILCKGIEKYNNEADESRIPKVDDMKRVIALLDRQMEDDYVGICGGLTNNKFSFEKIDNSDLIEMVDTRTPDEKNHDNDIMKKAQDLEEKEWKEIWEIISKGKSSNHGMKGWWD